MNKEISKKTIAFVKSLVKAKIVKGASLKNNDVMATFEELVNLPNQEAADKISPNVGMLYHEYTDWVETYKE